MPPKNLTVQIKVVLKCTLVVSLLAVVGIWQCIPMEYKNDKINACINIEALMSLSAESPINIDGDAALSSFCSGNGSTGSSLNPFIIENYLIDASAANGICISNTNAYLVIENCVIANGSSNYDGIYLSNTTNVKIINNSLWNNNIGIELELVNTTAVLSNNCSNNLYGLYMDSVNNNAIEANNYVLNTADGIWLGSGFNNTIFDNNCSFNTADGIQSGSSSNNTFGENICNLNNEGGIELEFANNNTIMANNCTFNYVNGVELDSSLNNTIAGNNCSSNNNNGIQLGSANSNIIIGNNCSNNIVGINLNSQNNYNLVWGNNLFDNSQYQAECGSNSLADSWDNNQIGNYYSDYQEQNPTAINNGLVWSQPYQINGTGTNQDAYPLVNKVTINVNTLQISTYASLAIPTLAPITPNPSNTGNITLTWTISAGASFYLVFRSPSAITEVQTLTPIATVTLNTYPDLGLANGNYYYVIVAVNGSGDSGFSNDQNVNVSLTYTPLAPVLNAILPNPSSNGIIFLNWTAVTGAISYNVYRYTGLITNVNASVIHLLNINASVSYNGTTGYNSAEDSGLINGTYYYVVTAINNTGKSQISNCQNVIVAIPIVMFLPTVPILNVIIPNPNLNGNISLSWNTVIGAIYYTIYQSNNLITSINGSVGLIGTTHSISFNNFGLTNGTYYYVVSAVKC